MVGLIWFGIGFGDDEKERQREKRDSGEDRERRPFCFYFIRKYILLYSDLCKNRN